MGDRGDQVLEVYRERKGRCRNGIEFVEIEGL